MRPEFEWFSQADWRLQWNVGGRQPTRGNHQANCVRLRIQNDLIGRDVNGVDFVMGVIFMSGVAFVVVGIVAKEQPVAEMKVVAIVVVGFRVKMKVSRSRRLGQQQGGNQQ